LAAQTRGKKGGGQEVAVFSVIKKEREYAGGKPAGNWKKVQTGMRGEGGRGGGDPLSPKKVTDRSSIRVEKLRKAPSVNGRGVKQQGGTRKPIKKNGNR